jgi:hypothetical protein
VLRGAPMTAIGMLRRGNTVTSEGQERAESGI